MSSYQAEYCVEVPVVGSKMTSCSVPAWMRVLSVWLQPASTQPPPMPTQEEENSDSACLWGLAVGTIQSPATEWKEVPRSILPWLYPDQLLEWLGFTAAMGPVCERMVGEAERAPAGTNAAPASARPHPVRATNHRFAPFIRDILPSEAQPSRIRLGLCGHALAAHSRSQNCRSPRGGRHGSEPPRSARRRCVDARRERSGEPRPARRRGPDARPDPARDPAARDSAGMSWVANDSAADGSVAMAGAGPAAAMVSPGRWTEPVTTRAARAVVMGTEATRPMEPTRVRTTSSARSSPVSTRLKGWLARVNRISRGRAAPAYASTSVYTVEAMWSRPIRMAEAKSARAPRVGLAWCNSHTAEAWVTVTSLSTPRDPMTMPPRMRPLQLMLPARVCRYVASSEPRRLRWVPATKTAAKRPGG